MAYSISPQGSLLTLYAARFRARDGNLGDARAHTHTRTHTRTHTHIHVHTHTHACLQTIQTILFVFVWTMCTWSVCKSCINVQEPRFPYTHTYTPHVRTHIHTHTRTHTHTCMSAYKQYKQYCLFCLDNVYVVRVQIMHKCAGTSVPIQEPWFPYRNPVPIHTHRTYVHTHIHSTHTHTHTHVCANNTNNTVCFV